MCNRPIPSISRREPPATLHGSSGCQSRMCLAFAVELCDTCVDNIQYPDAALAIDHEVSRNGHLTFGGPQSPELVDPRPSVTLATNTGAVYATRGCSAAASSDTGQNSRRSSPATAVRAELNLRLVMRWGLDPISACALCSSAGGLRWCGCVQLRYAHLRRDASTRVWSVAVVASGREEQRRRCPGQRRPE